MVNYLLDTNVISELIAKNADPNVVRWIDALDPGSVFLSVITIGELRKGIAKLPTSKRRASLEAWLNDDLLRRFSGRILVLDIPAMLLWGELTGLLERSGKSMPALDSLIAALARYHRCTLATRNVQDFQSAGIALVDPWQSVANEQ